MKFLIWKDSYNIGVKEIDNQHRGIFDLISKLYDTKAVYKDEKYFYATFQTLYDYAALHFSTEERYMKQAKYEKYDEHKKEHILFLQEASVWLEKLKSKEKDVEENLLVYLKDWYMGHILGTDREYQKTFIEYGFN